MLPAIEVEDCPDLSAAEDIESAVDMVRMWLNEGWDEGRCERKVEGDLTLWDDDRLLGVFLEPPDPESGMPRHAIRFF